MFPEFAEFLHGARNAQEGGAPPPEEALGLESTAQEASSLATAALPSELTSALRDQLKQVTPRRFEQIIVDPMLKPVYGGQRVDPGLGLAPPT